MDDQLVRYCSGAHWPAFAALFLPFMFAFFPIFRFARSELNVRAAAVTLSGFWVFMLAAERYSLWRGHWVYNEAKLLGPRFCGVPIEEPLIFYWLPGLLVLAVMLGFRRILRQRERR